MQGILEDDEVIVRPEKPEEDIICRCAVSELDTKPDELIEPIVPFLLKGIHEVIGAQTYNIDKKYGDLPSVHVHAEARAMALPKLALDLLFDEAAKRLFHVAPDRELLEVPLKRLGRTQLLRALPRPIVGVRRLLGLREGAGERGKRKYSETRKDGADPTHVCFFASCRSPVEFGSRTDRNHGVGRAVSLQSIQFTAKQDGRIERFCPPPPSPLLGAQMDQHSG